MSRQYVAARFRSSDQRTYTYHNDGEPVAVGDRVVVSTAKGPQTVTVAEVTAVPPPFATKPIVGKERPASEPAAPADPLSAGIGF